MKLNKGLNKKVDFEPSDEREDYMRNNKSKFENQMELDFQAISKRASKQEKEFQQPVKAVSVQSSKTGLSDIDLSKQFDKGKIRKITYSDKKPIGLLFDNLITVEELAVIFGLAPQTIRNWVAQGKLPYVKIGKRNMFLTGSIKKWLNRKEKSQRQ